jgi:hypothetical protein
MSDSLYETKLGSINSSIEILGNKSMKFDNNKWQLKKQDSGFDKIPEKRYDYDDMSQESREELSDNESNEPNEKDFGSIDHMKEFPVRDSKNGLEKISQST